MTFLVGERVSCVLMHNNPLINQESHCTASFHGLLVVLANLLFHLIKSFIQWQEPRKLLGRGDVEKEKEGEGAIEVGDCSSSRISSTPCTPTKRWFRESIVLRYECI